MRIEEWKRCQPGQFDHTNLSTGDFHTTAKLLNCLLQARFWPPVIEMLVRGIMVKNEKQRSLEMFNTLAIISFYFFAIYKERRHNL